MAVINCYDRICNDVVQGFDGSDWSGSSRATAFGKFFHPFKYLLLSREQQTVLDRQGAQRIACVHEEEGTTTKMKVAQKKQVLLISWLNKTSVKEEDASC